MPWKDPEKQKQAQRDWYKRNRASHRTKGDANYQAKKAERAQKAKERRAKRRMLVLEHYGGDPPKCACCGEDEPRFLALDHIEGNGNSHRKSIGSGGDVVWRWIIREGFPPGFRVLCHNCNFAMQFDGGCPHATATGT
jgi:hypothetical protein